MSLPLKLASTFKASCDISVRGIRKSRGKVVKTYDGQRFYPNDTSEREFDQIQDFHKVKNEKDRVWPFYGGRITSTRTQNSSFPQSAPIIVNEVKDMRPKKTPKTVRFGAAPHTYPTTLVYPDGSTITVPYHKPAGTIYLPGDSTTISADKVEKKTTMRRVRVSRDSKMFGK